MLEHAGWIRPATVHPTACRVEASRGTRFEKPQVRRRLRQAVEAHEFDEVGQVTVSLGVISVAGEVERRRVFACVDDALYQAKAGGRNQVVLATL